MFSYRLRDAVSGAMGTTDTESLSVVAHVLLAWGDRPEPSWVTDLAAASLGGMSAAPPAAIVRLLMFFSACDHQPEKDYVQASTAS